MGFYDKIGSDIPYEITSNTDSYLKVVGGKRHLRNTGWLQWHLRYLDKVIDAIHAFRNGQLRGYEYDMSLIQKTLVHNSEEGINILKKLDSEYTLFSIDIETSNLSTDKLKNKLLCIGIAYSMNAGVSFMRSCFDNKDFVEAFKKFVQDDKHKFILHNGIFDKSRTKLIADIDLKIDEDTLLMHYVGINEHKGTHGLKELAQLYLGFTDWEKPLDEWKRQYCRSHKVKLSEFQYEWFPQDTLAEYNVIDCVATYQLYYTLKPLMRENSHAIYRTLVRASEYYSDMIVRGMLVDVEYIHQLENQLSSENEKIYDYLDKHIPGVLITSPKQLMDWLHKKFPNEIIESTDAKALEDLSYKYPDVEELKQILKLRTNEKYLKTYVYGILSRMDSNNVIHCEFKLHGTETGRLSSANPNMQNIPRNSTIKKIFKAHEGYELLCLDYSQAELRVLAYISQDDKLMETYIAGRDLHTEMQKHLFGDKFDPHNKDQRVIAKTINFGIPYGRTAGGMSKTLGMSLAEAKDYLNKWFAGAPKVLDFIAQQHKMALADPQEVYYTPFGRCRKYFITSDNIYHVQNQAVNFPISSTANDLTIHSLVQIADWLKEKKFDAYLVNTVHDSIIIEVRHKDAKEIAEYCQQVMANTPKKYLTNCKVPFRADAEIGVNYGDMHEADWYEEDDAE